MDPAIVDANCIYKVLAGSHAYGTNHGGSDKDIRGVMIPPPEYIIGLLHFEQSVQLDPVDQTIYGLRKFCHLALQCNPNIIELLNVREQEIAHITDAGRQLRDAAPWFLSSKAFQTFGGYARAQLKKFVSKGGKTGRAGTIPEGETAGWKNAMHLIRLLRMGCELLETGEVHVYRHDRDELLSIRRGEWTLEQVLVESERLEARLQTAYDNTKLPAKPRFNGVNTLVMNITADFLKRNDIPAIP